MCEYFEVFQHIHEKRTVSSVKYFIRTVLESGPTSRHRKKTILSRAISRTEGNNIMQVQPIRPSQMGHKYYDCSNTSEY